MKFDISEYFETLPRKFNLHQNMRSRIMGPLHNDVFTVMTSDEKCFRQNMGGKSEHKLQVQALLPKSCLVRDNVEKYGTAREDTDINIMRRMRIACCIPRDSKTYKHTHTHRICNIYCLSLQK